MRMKRLKLSKNSDHTMVRPSHNESSTDIKLEVLLYAILDVNEKDQQFVSYIWVILRWQGPDIRWVRDDFCNIEWIYPPSSVLWMPDITIEEMIEKNKVVESPYLSLSFSGEVYTRTNMVVVTSCRIRVYKFPFDVQSCNLTFKSYIHTEDEIKLYAYDSKWNIEWSLKKMTQTEWLFTNLTISRETVFNFDTSQTVIVYTISMKRRSALYVANFLVPILFFLCLDLTSFLISDTGGEKLSFKVTVLLAVTVMQLILNEILPASSDRIPLIAIFCIGIFGLMMLSLLETIVVMRLLEKDSASQANKADEDQSLKLENRTPSVCNVSVDETPSEQLSKEDNSSQPTEEFNALEKISDELKEMEKTLTRVLHSTKEEVKPGYWTRVVKIVNIVFFFFYVTAVSVLLSVLFILWNELEDQ
ncbi:5-hydroxytryptamine receptor 3A-like [Anarhichas minor]|uniref:5-hydroxytryptamine receptor 3A-like n=1 Tax=Anarhichas minor TaxID=65739 RepID=UPI003F73D31F